MNAHTRANGRLKQSPEDRFWAHVDKRGPDDCWNWKGAARTTFGYGAIRINGKSEGAHRFSFKLHNDENIDALVVRHRCHNPGCVNPKHLISGTPYDNAQDRVKAGRAGKTQKFSQEVITAVRFSAGTNKEVAARFGMSPTRVHEIRHGDGARPQDGIVANLRALEFIAVEALRPNSCVGCLLENASLRECMNAVRTSRERGTKNCDDIAKSGHTHIYILASGVASSVEQDVTPITNKTN